MLLSGACDKAEPIPSYLRVEPFVVTSEGGTSWQKITDCWLYVNGQLLGGYSLPADIPVLATGECEVQLFAGVKENGSKNTPGVMPFFQPFVRKVTLTAAETTTFNPTTSYYPNTKFAWALDETTFDGGSSIIFENRDTDTATTFVVTEEGGFAGKSLHMAVDTGHVLIEVATESVPLPNSGATQVWLEMHHRNDMPFALILLGRNNNGSEESAPVYVFNPTADDGWNKIYLNLTDYVSFLQKQQYRLYFRVLLSPDNTGRYTQTQGNVRLDNLRLLHF
jgi:hypothetical protein